MSFTYTSQPMTVPSDEVRFLIGDTDSTQPILDDQEIAWLLYYNQDDALSAAIQACEGIIARLARSRDEHVGSVSIRFSQDVAGFEAVLANLRRRLGKMAIPYAGGISMSDKMANRANTDRVKPSFTRDLMQNPDDPETLAGVDDDTDSVQSDGTDAGGLYGSD